MRATALIVLLVIGYGTATAESLSYEKLVKLRGQKDALLRKGQWREAVPLLRNLLRTTGDSALLLELGKCNERLKKITLAAYYWRVFIESSTSSVVAIAVMAKLKSHRERLRKETEALRKSKKYTPALEHIAALYEIDQSPEQIFEAGVVFKQSKQPILALNAFRHFVQLAERQKGSTQDPLQLSSLAKKIKRAQKETKSLLKVMRKKSRLYKHTVKADVSGARMLVFSSERNGVSLSPRTFPWLKTPADLWLPQGTYRVKLNDRFREKGEAVLHVRPGSSSTHVDLKPIGDFGYLRIFTVSSTRWLKLDGKPLSGGNPLFLTLRTGSHTVSAETLDGETHSVPVEIKRGRLAKIELPLEEKKAPVPDPKPETKVTIAPNPYHETQPEPRPRPTSRPTPQPAPEPEPRRVETYEPPKPRIEQPSETPQQEYARKYRALSIGFYVLLGTGAALGGLGYLFHYLHDSDSSPTKTNTERYAAYALYGVGGACGVIAFALLGARFSLRRPAPRGWSIAPSVIPGGGMINSFVVF